jgi:hypothetical protein
MRDRRMQIQTAMQMSVIAMGKVDLPAADLARVRHVDAEIRGLTVEFTCEVYALLFEWLDLIEDEDRLEINKKIEAALAAMRKVVDELRTD